MRCTNCGKKIMENTRYCRFCGEEVHVAEVSAADVPRCNVCGKALEPGAKFCIYCGNDTEASKGKSVEKTKKCKACGKKMFVDEKFCTYCGTRVEMERPPIIPKEPPIRRKDIEEDSSFSRAGDL